VVVICWLRIGGGRWRYGGRGEGGIRPGVEVITVAEVVQEVGEEEAAVGEVAAEASRGRGRGRGRPRGREGFVGIPGSSLGRSKGPVWISDRGWL
jgi:hypothetical protein